MGRKTPSCPLYPEWTQAKFKSFLKSGLRTLSTKWPPAHKILKQNRRASQREDKRIKWEYQCNHCKQWFLQKEIERNHIIPVGGFSQDFSKWPEEFGKIAERMFVGVDGYDLLCKECHAKLTEQQNQERRDNK